MYLKPISYHSLVRKTDKNVMNSIGNAKFLGAFINRKSILKEYKEKVLVLYKLLIQLQQECYITLWHYQM